ncbi:hypothetical protein HYV86_04540 [Candidatus Woesearchaeota archaeon]|nr:hypothetical protein [Candidatus Woesearchaeota archaeon]
MANDTYEAVKFDNQRYSGVGVPRIDNLNRSYASQAHAIVFVEGSVQANPSQGIGQDLTPANYIATVLEPAIKRGEVADGSQGPFDDRKHRFHSFSLRRVEGGSEPVLLVHTAPTTYQAFRAELEAEKDPARGRSYFEGLITRTRTSLFDEYAFHSRIGGVGGLVFSKTGAVYVGTRAEGNDVAGLADAVSAHMPFFGYDPKDIDLNLALLKAVQRERGVLAQDIVATEFIGAGGDKYRGDFDFVWLIHTSLPDEHFTGDAWKQYAGRKNAQTRLVAARSMEDVERMLQADQLPDGTKTAGMHYTLEHALRNINADDFKSR